MSEDSTTTAVGDKSITHTNKAGHKTTEFWGKTAVQVALVASMFFGLEVDEEMIVKLVAGIEAAYVLGRSIVKGMKARG